MKHDSREAGAPRVRSRRAMLGMLGSALAISSLGMSAAGCAKGTYLEIRFVGPAALDIRAIRVELTVTPPNGGTVLHSTDTVTTGARITLPTSMALKLDSENGDIRVTATALGSANLPLASDTMTTPIKHAETSTITLRFGLVAASEELDQQSVPQLEQDLAEQLNEQVARSRTRP